MVARALVDGGQAEHLPEFVAVEADDGKVIGDTEAEIPGGKDCPDRGTVPRF